VTQVDLPSEGETLKRHEVFASVESVKAVSDVYAPVSGKVVKVNSPSAGFPEYVNEGTLRRRLDGPSRDVQP